MVSSSVQSPVTSWPYTEQEEEDERLLRHEDGGGRFSLGTGGSGVLWGTERRGLVTVSYRASA